MPDAFGGAEQHAIGDAEHRGVEAEPQRQRRDHAERKHRLPRQAAADIAQVLPQGIDPIGETLPPRARVGLRVEGRAAGVEVAEAARCLGQSVLARHPARNQILHARLQVRADLVVDLAAWIAQIRHGATSRATPSAGP